MPQVPKIDGNPLSNTQQYDRVAFETEITIPKGTSSDPVLNPDGAAIHVDTTTSHINLNVGSGWVDTVTQATTLAASYTDTKVATALHFEPYTNFTDLPSTGPTAFCTVDHDNSPLGDNEESQFIRQNNKYFYLVAVEQ